MSNRHLVWLISAAAFGGQVARGEPSPPRPDLSAAVPIATCQLQTAPVQSAPRYEQVAVGLYSLSRPADDPLANYQRTPLGDWPIAAEADRNDPWLRLLLLSRKRPVVIDLAVFIDGRSFRHAREAWIDDVIAEAKAQVHPANNQSAGAANELGNNNLPQQGTNTAQEASVGDESGASPADGPPRLGGPTVAAQSRQAPTMRERLLNYVNMSGAEVDRAEVGWLLSEWGAGPGVVLLAPALSWQRSGLAPLETYLDQDADGALSREEIVQVETILKSADLNGDDVMEMGEMRRVDMRRATKRTAVNGADGHPLIVLLDAKTDWGALMTTLAKIYDEAGSTSANDPRGLLAVPADITLRVDFRTVEVKDKPAIGASVISVGQGLSASSEAVIASNDVLSLDVAGDFLEFSAAQSTASNNVSASQIAVGAVIDGNPLLRMVDRDQDSRLTLRERQELQTLLTELDRDKDGAVSSEEIPMPIRLAVTLGPQVHELLSAPVGSVRTFAPGDAVPAPPDWFASMDKNQDRDLSRDEFLGTTEQFRQFDADGDELLSVAEALKLNNSR